VASLSFLPPKSLPFPGKKASSPGFSIFPFFSTFVSPWSSAKTTPLLNYSTIQLFNFSTIQLLNYLTLLLLPLGLFSQNGLPPNAGARGAALGNTSVAHRDIYGVFSNPAGLLELSNWGIAVMGEQRFLLPEIRLMGVAAAINSDLGAFGLYTHRFGIEAYHEQQFGIQYARALFEKFNMGIGMDLLHTRIPDYGGQINLTGHIGLQAHFSEPLWLGMYLFNPFRIKRNNGEYLPSMLRVGFTYQPSSKVLLTGEAEKDIDFPLRWKGGLEYQYFDLLALRVGFSTHPVQATMGAGLSWEKRWQLDFALQWHQILGWTPVFSAVYQAF